MSLTPLQYLAASSDVAGFLRTSRSVPGGGNPSQVLAASRASSPSSLTSSHNDERWAELEQACAAAITTGAIGDAAAHLEALRARFGARSARVLRLGGALLEAVGRRDAAARLYSCALASDAHATSAPLFKREAGLARSSEEAALSARGLRDYLSHFSGDGDAWLEMAELQLQVGASPAARRAAASESLASRAAQAAFCVEEALLASPGSAALHARAAELLCHSAGASAAPAPFASQESLLRGARLHASEAVGLSDRRSAYCLAALADASYLHACAARGIAPDGAARILLGTPLDGYASATAVALALNANRMPAFASSKGNAVSQVSPICDASDEDAALHALASDHLQRLIDAKSEAKAGSCDSSLPTQLAPDTPFEVFGARCRLGDVFPALEVEDALKCPAVLEILREQERVFQN